MNPLTFVQLKNVTTASPKKAISKLISWSKLMRLHSKNVRIAYLKYSDAADEYFT